MQQPIDIIHALTFPPDPYRTLNTTFDFGSSSPSTITDLLIDSRSLLNPPQSLFFALTTTRDDGHRYIAPLYAKGVRAFVVNRTFSKRDDFPHADFFFVDNPAMALRAIALHQRNNLAMPVVAITGSRGKTIVKEWLYQMFSSSRRVSRSPRSYNSSLGVPLSLCQIDPGAELALIEAGISQSGEMDALRHMIRPSIVVLTDIDSTHDDGFACRADKITEKLRLASEASTLVYPADDADIARAVKASIDSGILPRNLTIVDSSNIPLPQITHLNETWELRNLRTCLAVARVLGMDMKEALHAAYKLHPMRTRLNVSEGVNHCLIVADDYTCDLHSLRPALDFLNRRTTADRTTTLILSDMGHETMSPSETYHATSELCSRRNVSRIIGIGDEISRYHHLFPPHSTFYRDMESALASLSPSDFDHELIMVKGMPGSGLEKVVSMLEARTHATVLEVNLDALISNYNFYRSKLRPETGIVAMVKASGYGAGSYELAKTLQSRGAAYLAVAVLDEGIDLRNAGITMPVMVLNPKVLNYRLLFANRLEPEIYGFEILNEIIAEARKLDVRNYPVHLKFDTGMHRLGFLENDIPQLIQLLLTQDNICISSVFSHLATADCPDMDSYTDMQLETFERCSAKIIEAFPYKIKRHILNTAGIIRRPQYQYDMVRLGIGLYGVPVLNDGSEAPLRQVSTLRSPIISIKRWAAGTTIGYGRRGVLTRESLIATVPVGYADGVNRHMGCGRVSFIVNGAKCPTVGNICMDICMIDVTDVPGVKVGDSVEIFGEANPASALSQPLGTIPYEILTSVSPRVPRLYFSE